MANLVIGISVGAIYGLVAVGIVLVYKSSRVLNFAQAEFGTFALYLTWFLSTQRHLLSWWAAAVVGIVVAVAIGLAFESLVVRQMGDASRVTISVATAGLMFLFFGLEILLWGPSPRLVNLPVQGGINFAGTGLSWMQAISIAVLIVLGIGLGILVQRTRLGLGLLAVAEDPPTARLMGVPYNRISAFTWGMAGALGAVGGLLIGPLQGAFGPLSLTSSLFVPGLTAALLGGLTSLPGAFVGGIGVGLIETQLRSSFSDVIGIGSYGMLAVILLVLLVRPRGLLGREA